MARYALLLSLLTAAVQSSPTPDVFERDYATGKLPDVFCKKVNIIVTVLKAYKATPFCFSYLSIPAVTSTSTVKTTNVATIQVTSTITALPSVTTTTSFVTLPGTATYVFRPGNPPVPAQQKRDNAIEERNVKLEKPDYLKAFANDVISSGCKCLDIPVKTVVVSTTATATSTATSTTTTTTTPMSTSTVTGTTTVGATTSTLYPCATPLATLIPTIPYGDAVSPTDLGVQNSIFYLNDPKGSSAAACCNTCYFDVPNCIQAFFYSYQGCVVQQASSSGSGVGVSSSCPSGLFSGLTYTTNASPAFRSTGNFAGPCGVQYNNL